MFLVSPSERLAATGTRSTRWLPKQPPDRADPPLMALPACASSPCSHWCVHSRPTAAEAAACHRVGVPIPTSCSVHVVSHHLDGFLRTRAVGLLRPTPGLEVHCVSADRDPRSPRTEVRDTVGGQPPSPQCGCHPSKGYPRQQPYRITAALAFLPLPSLGSPRGRHLPRSPLLVNGFSTLFEPATEVADTRSSRLQGFAPLSSP
jgi:hypothetical protein